MKTKHNKDKSDSFDMDKFEIMYRDFFKGNITDYLVMNNKNEKKATKKIHICKKTFTLQDHQDTYTIHLKSNRVTYNNVEQPLTKIPMILDKAKPLMADAEKNKAVMKIKKGG